MSRFLSREDPIFQKVTDCIGFAYAVNPSAWNVQLDPTRHSRRDRERRIVMPKVETHDWPVATSSHTPNWNAAIRASIIAGLVFAALEVLLVWAGQHQSPWMPLHMIGAVVLGTSV